MAKGFARCHHIGLAKKFARVFPYGVRCVRFHQQLTEAWWSVSESSVVSSLSAPVSHSRISFINIM